MARGRGQLNRVAASRSGGFAQLTPAPPENWLATLSRALLLLVRLCKGLDKGEYLRRTRTATAPHATSLHIFLERPELSALLKRLYGEKTSWW